MEINDSKISNSEKLIYKANILLIENTKKLSIYSNKNQNYKFGEIIEVDACQDIFFKTNEKIHIYHAIDAKSGALVALWAEKEKTNKGYQKLFELNQKYLDQQNKTTIEIIKNQTKIYNELIEINQKNKRFHLAKNIKNLLLN